MAKKILVEVGKLGKTFGFEGSLKLKINPGQLDHLRQATFVFIETAGNKVPYFVEQISEDAPLTIKLEDLDSKEAAQLVAGQKVFIEKAHAPQQEKRLLDELQDFKDLVGFMVEDEEAGTIGQVADVFELPQQWMAAVNYQDGEVLIPLNPALITAVDAVQGVIYTSLPEGLLEL